MPRGAVYEILDADLTLRTSLGGPGRIFGKDALDGVPQEGYVLLLVWAAPRVVFRDYGSAPEQASVKRLSVEVHRARTESTDYKQLDVILARVTLDLCSAVQVVGTDGSNVAHVELVAISEDATDLALNTITKNATYNVLGR